MKLAVIENRLLVELSVHAGVILTHEHLLQKVWRKRSGGDTRPIRAAIKSPRRKLGDDADNPTYIFNEPIEWGTGSRWRASSRWRWVEAGLCRPFDKLRERHRVYG